MANPHIEILTDDTELSPSVRDALDQIGATFELRRLDGDAPEAGTRAMDARLVVTGNPQWNGGGKVDKLAGWVRDHPCPTLIYSALSGEPLQSTEFADDAGPVSCAFGLSGDALAGHLSAMCTIGGAMASMRRQMSALRSEEASLRGRVKRLGRDLKLAGDLQRDLLPAVLPDVKGLEVHTLYRPAEAVSGDSYDVVRIAPARVAFTLADATGHGVAAGLLCASFLRSLRRAPETEATCSEVEPAAILADLNRELCAAELSECLFVTAVHAIYDEDRGVVRWARAGAPYPVLIRRGEDPLLLRSEGPAAGMIEDPQFETVETQLEPGDVLLFHTDGLDEALAMPDHAKCGESVVQTRWYQELARQPFRRCLVELDGILAGVQSADERKDDTTILALERRMERAHVVVAEPGQTGARCDPAMV